MQWNSLLFPCFHQRPVHRTEKQVLAAASDKRVFDFGEVVEIIQNGSFLFCSLYFFSVLVLCTCSLYLSSYFVLRPCFGASCASLWLDPCPFVNQPQALERKYVVYLFNEL